MPDSVEYDIALDLQAALQAISIAGGYNFDVEAAAVSLNPDDFTPEILLGSVLHDPFFLILGEAGRSIRYSGANQLLELVPFTIFAATDVELLDPLSKLAAIQQLHADIETALVVDVTRGGRATDTRIVDKQHDTPTGSRRVLVIVQVHVRLHRQYGAPNG